MSSSNYSGVLILLLIAIGCETDIDMLTPDFQSVPIIYGVIDPFDSVKQSVRIERTFRIKDKAGAQLQDADSLYYESVQAWLIGMNEDQEIWRVELKKDFLPKDSGAFTGENHHVYSHYGKLPINLVGKTDDYPGFPDIDYLCLTVQVNDIDQTVSSTVTVFSPAVVYNSGFSSKQIHLYNHPSTFSIYATSKSSENFDVKEIKFRVYIHEFSDYGKYPKCIEWFTSSLNGGTYTMSPERFCNRVMMGLDLSDSIDVRTLDSINVEMTLVSPTFTTYCYQSNFEGMLDYPSTNITGAYGVYTTKSKGTLYGMYLDNQSLDTLCYGQKWKHLKFVHW